MRAIDVIFLLSEAGQRQKMKLGLEPVQRASVRVEDGAGAWGLAIELATFAPDGSALVEVGHRDWTEDGAAPVPVVDGAGLTERTILFDNPTPDVRELLEAEQQRRAAVAAFEARAAEVRAKADEARRAKADEARRERAARLRDGIESGIAEIERLGGDATALRESLESAGPSNQLERLVDGEVEMIREARAAEARADWIRLHGSDRLKTCLEEGFEHRAAYLDERLAAERPGWVKATRSRRISLAEPRNPPAGALALLKEARAADPHARLRYATIERRGAVEVKLGERASKFAWIGFVVTGRLDGERITLGEAWEEPGQQGRKAGRVPIRVLRDHL